MKMLKTSTVLAAASALLIAASAHAMTGSHGTNSGGHGVSGKSMSGTKQAVVSTNGGVVMSSFGDCVVTKWDSAAGECTAMGSELRTVYFEFNSSALTAASKTKLNSLAKALKKDSVSAVSIVGFADEIGSTTYNQRLSEKRANNVAAYLRGKGIKVNGKSEIRGLGETSSKSDCADKKGKEQRACLWRDRRVEVEVAQ